MLKALLVGQSRDRLSGVSLFLQQRNCEVRYAASYGEAKALFQGERPDFHLVLGPIRIGNQSGLELADLLEGTKANLFYCYTVEQGSWWMPALREGRKCFGTPALRDSEFTVAVDEILRCARLSSQLGLEVVPEQKRRAAS